MSLGIHAQDKFGIMPRSDKSDTPQLLPFKSNEFLQNIDVAKTKNESY